jgi:dihydroorotate dehydrogenase electron transfer subunit
MKNVMLKIAGNVKMGKDLYLMRLEGDVSEIKNPGEFIKILLPGHYLRRPISVCDFDASHVDILFKILGHGTNDMSEFKVCDMLDCLIGLGNGFTLYNDKKPLLIGGGIGIAPLIGLAKRFNEMGIKPDLVYGARSKDDLVLLDVLNELCNVTLCTDDGLVGYHGNVVVCINKNNISFDYYYSCGLYRMHEAVAKSFKDGVVSMEARMGCGFGACMGCSIKTTNGPKRVCKEGPVFIGSEVEF